MLLQFVKTLAVAVLIGGLVQSSPVPAIYPDATKAGGNLQLLTNSFRDKTNFNGPTIPDVKTTVEQVQQLLETDPTLPRLTRGEIEDLFEQVTKEEFEKSVRSGDITKAKQMRALMLVLPYNTNNDSSDNLQELYNRPPITKVISSDTPALPKLQKIVVPSGKVEIISVDPNPTTYKPTLFKNYPAPTTYRPSTTFASAHTDHPILGNPPTSYYDLDNPTKITTGRFSSHYSAKKTSFQNGVAPTPLKPIRIPQKTTTNKPKVTPELEELLESLGFPQKSQSKKRFKLDDPMEELPKPVISSLIRQHPIEVDEFKPLPISITANHFKKSIIPQIRSQDYVAFKPIPTSSENLENIQPDLEDYLRKFGLIDVSRGRSNKSIKAGSDRLIATTRAQNRRSPSQRSTFNPTKYPVTGEADLKRLESLLETIKELQRLNISLTEADLDKLESNNFNLSDSLLAQGPNPIIESELDNSKNEIKRQTESPEPTRYSLGLDVDESVDSSKTTDSLNDLVREIPPVSSNSDNDDSSSSKSSSNSDRYDKSSGSSSDESEEINLRLLNEPDLKAEAASENFEGMTSLSLILSTTSAPTTTSTTTTTTTESSVVNESRNGAIADLEDSFGGGGLDPTNEEPLPEPKRNGFYFLADWNSFLEVGEDPEKVIVRFDPKIGDPSPFIRVNVP